MNTARELTATITCAAASNYTGGDVLAASATDTAGTATEITGAARGAGQGVTFLNGVAICSEDDVRFRLRLHVFDLAPVAAEVEMDDNAVYGLTTAAGAAKWIGDIDFSAFADKGGVSGSEMIYAPKTLKCDPTTSSLFVVAEAVDAETNETAAMTIDLRLWVI